MSITNYEQALPETFAEQDARLAREAVLELAKKENWKRKSFEYCEQSFLDQAIAQAEIDAFKNTIVFVDILMFRWPVKMETEGDPVQCTMVKKTIIYREKEQK